MYSMNSINVQMSKAGLSNLQIVTLSCDNDEAVMMISSDSMQVFAIRRVSGMKK